LADLSHKPVVLYHASIERINGARRLVDAPIPDYVMAMYQAGLAIECIVQALALRSGATHDARHNLASWLSKCPSNFQEAVKRQLRAEWNLLVVVWG
jgi:hypothetical protein